MSAGTELHWVTGGYNALQTAVRERNLSVDSANCGDMLLLFVSLSNTILNGVSLSCAQINETHSFD